MSAELIVLTLSQLIVGFVLVATVVLGAKMLLDAHRRGMRRVRRAAEREQLREQLRAELASGHVTVIR